MVVIVLNEYVIIGNGPRVFTQRPHNGATSLMLAKGNIDHAVASNRSRRHQMTQDPSIRKAALFAP